MGWLDEEKRRAERGERLKEGQKHEEEAMIRTDSGRLLEVDRLSGEGGMGEDEERQGKRKRLSCGHNLVIGTTSRRQTLEGVGWRREGDQSEVVVM